MRRFCYGIMLLLILTGCSSNTSITHAEYTERPASDNKSSYAGNVAVDSFNVPYMSSYRCEGDDAVFTIDLTVNYRGAGELGLLIGDDADIDRFHHQIIDVDGTKPLMVRGIEIHTEGKDADVIVKLVGAGSKQLVYGQIAIIPATQCMMNR